MKAEDLKNSILQLAMEGKLVPQNLNDEPASVLLEKIRKEKEQLIKEKKIKRNNKESFIFRKNGHVYEKIGKNGEPVCIDDEIPFDIPNNWEWVRINTIREVYTGNSINKTEKETKFTSLAEGHNYIATKDVKFDNSIDYNNGVKIPKDLEKFRVAPRGSVLLCIEGGSAGRKIGILNQDVCFGNKLACFKTFNENNNFLFYYLQSPNFKQIFKSKKTGIIGGVGIAKLRNVLMPIPPLNEQKRIIIKLQEVFPKINEYGVNEEKLDKLNSEFPDKLKSSILQEAIHGKLVPQDPNDEPASVLLEKIREEKERLIKEKKIKRNKNESYIFKENNHFYEKVGKKDEIICIDSEIQFDIPNNWQWARLNTISQINPRNQLDDELDVSFIPMNLIDESYSNSYTFEIKKWKNIKKGYTHFAKNDIVIAKITPCFENLKSTILYNLKNDYGAGTTELHIIRPYSDLLSLEYLLFLFKSPYFIKNGEKNFTGTAGQKRIGKRFVESFLIPLPPLSEQKRIVEKINDLLKELS